MRRSLLLASLVFSYLHGAPALAGGNAPSGAQYSAEQSYLPKIVLSCGVPLSIHYDSDSLKQHNKDIGHDQTGGSNECDEPLRYLWYACKTPAGKAAIKAARISKIVCKGVPGTTGSLGLSDGTIVVGRAFEEPKPFLRSRRQFETLLHFQLTLPGDDPQRNHPKSQQKPARISDETSGDPYYDEAWHALAQQPNPVTSTTSYCLVNGEKVEWNEHAYSTFEYRKENATVKCWKDGSLVIDLVLKLGKKTGFLTHFRDSDSTRVTYRDDKQHGEVRSTKAGKLSYLASYEDGERMWEKELHPDGKLAHYSRKLTNGYADLTIDSSGKVQSLQCKPEVKDDQELRAWCGFSGARTTSIYDGTGKVTRIETWKDGVIQKRAAGDSAYAQRSDVAYKDGQKHGEERIIGKTGALAEIITWDHGKKDGKNQVFSDDGKKVIKEIIWKADEMQQLTELYLNGNPKLRETYESAAKKQRKTYWDTGKLKSEGELLLCGGYGYRRDLWCEEGVHKTYYEDGAHESERAFHAGSRHDVAKIWWPNGMVAQEEEYANGTLKKAKRWDKDGKLLSDERFEADGSRISDIKLKR